MRLTFYNEGMYNKTAALGEMLRCCRIGRIINDVLATLLGVVCSSNSNLNHVRVSSYCASTYRGSMSTDLVESKTLNICR